MTWFGRRDEARIGYERMSGELLSQQGETADKPPEGGLAANVDWLRGVTGALAIVYLATQIDTDESSGLSAVEDRGSPAGPAVAIDREINQKLHDLIAALPPEAAALIRATYFEGLTLQEAGTRLGVRKSWASRLHAKALERLARGLRLEGITA